MSEQNSQSLEEFSDQLRRLVTPSVMGGAEELFYQLGWKAANASRTTSQRTESAFRPFAVGLATGIATMLVLSLSTGKPILDSIDPARKIVTDQTSRDKSVTVDPQLVRPSSLSRFDELESLFAFVPVFATHGLTREARDKPVIPNSIDGVAFPKNQSMQSFRQEVMKEIKL